MSTKAVLLTLSLAALSTATLLPRWDWNGGGWNGGGWNGGGLNGGGSNGGSLSGGNSNGGSSNGGSSNGGSYSGGGRGGDWGWYGSYQDGASQFFNGRSGFDQAIRSGLRPNSYRFETINFHRASLIRIAHGVLAAVTFVFIFPVGAIVLRLLPGRLSVILHALTQLFGYLTFIAAAGMGLYMVIRVRFEGFNFLTTPRLRFHPIIGLVLLVLIFFQPFLGILHHVGFKKNQRRGIFSYFHVWIGRLAITLGMINGGLGLYIAGNASRGRLIAYGIVAAIMWLAMVSAAIVGRIFRRRRSRGPKPVGAGAPVTKAAAMGHGHSHAHGHTNGGLGSHPPPVIPAAAGAGGGLGLGAAAAGTAAAPRRDYLGREIGSRASSPISPVTGSIISASEPTGAGAHGDQKTGERYG